MKLLGKPKQHTLLIIFTLFLYLWSNSSFALSEKEVEINHLLQFIGNANCSFVRNGDSHPSSEAKSHINRKYNYLKSKINSTEDFIKYTATKSSISGKYYKVICKGEEKTSKQWLLDELAAYRKNPSQ